MIGDRKADEIDETEPIHSAPPRFVGIVGVPRCGSTMVGSYLGLGGRAIFVGEATRFRLQYDRVGRCGCGEQIPSCGFWQSVLRHGGELPESDTDYSAIASILRSAIELSGASLLIDSSKSAVSALALAEHLGWDSTILMVVRDPRGHVISVHQGWRAKRTNDADPDWALLARVTGSWWKHQALDTWRLRIPRRCRLVKYDKFEKDPARETGVHGPLVDGEVPFNHSIAGNPSRKTPNRAIAGDVRWHSMPPLKQLAVFVLGLPFTAIYRYPPIASFSVGRRKAHLR